MFSSLTPNWIFLGCVLGVYYLFDLIAVTIHLHKYIDIDMLTRV